MAQKRPLYERVNAALDEGKLWRAKEMLQGNLGTRGYDVELYERYGQLLLQMGDDVEAGRFLFLSGAREPEYAAAIELYIERYKNAGPRALCMTFPYSARRPSLRHYPEAVQTELRALGVSTSDLARPRRARRERDSEESLGDKACQACGCLFILGVLACFGVGTYVVARWGLAHIRDFFTR